MDKCPYCGGESYYTKDYMYGSGEWVVNFDGLPADNSEYHSGLRYKQGKIAYCSDCNKRLGLVKDIERQ